MPVPQCALLHPTFMTHNLRHWGTHGIRIEGTGIRIGMSIMIRRRIDMGMKVMIRI